MNDNISILKRLYKDYTSKFIKKIFYAVLLTVVLAASTSSIAYLLDPAIKKIFIDKDQTLIYLIPLAIVIAFTAKGISLYGARHIMIGVAEEVKANVQKDMIKSFVIADTQFIEKKHSGKMVSNLTADVGMLTFAIFVAIANLCAKEILGSLFSTCFLNILSTASPVAFATAPKPTPFTGLPHDTGMLLFQEFGEAGMSRTPNSFCIILFNPASPPMASRAGSFCL